MIEIHALPRLEHYQHSPHLVSALFWPTTFYIDLRMQKQAITCIVKIHFSSDLFLQEIIMEYFYVVFQQHIINLVTVTIYFIFFEGSVLGFCLLRSL